MRFWAEEEKPQIPSFEDWCEEKEKKWWQREPLRVDWEKKRIWVYGRRFHHLDAGIILVLIGLFLIIHD